ncbi:MAG: polysaccharide biosynthesis tyrosine autokinase [Deltaproteobacteria bacterium]|nr:polysaccharide biosynthesis tyrosine autokinase [Deltaproteobacteria bacterium]
MGKISKALDKYASERKLSAQQPLPAASPLTHDDIIALVGYDEKTGHLLKADPATGNVDECRIEELRAGGTVLRLLENQLIYPGGKLTVRGVEEARRLAAVAAAIPRRPAASDADRDRLLQETEYSADSPIPSAPEPEPKGGPAPAPTAPVEPQEKLIEAYAVAPSPQTVEPPPPAAPRPLKVVPEPKPAAAKPATPLQPLQPKAASKMPHGHGQPPLWDEAAIDHNLVALTDSHSPEAEQFKILRTNILFPLAGSPPRSILVTSSGPCEGKTFTAANLAISIALNINRHVLLIDADMRRPQLHKRFGFGSVPGLSDYLAEGRLLPSLLLKTKVDKLTLLAAGPPPDNPAELIGAERMSNLLAEVSTRYPDRIVVIDAPPPTLAAETGVLARQVDGILVVVRYGSTRRDDLADLIAQVGQKKILGSIVNYLENPASRYYGYKYAGYGKRKDR